MLNYKISLKTKLFQFFNKKLHKITFIEEQSASGINENKFFSSNYYFKILIYFISDFPIFFKLFQYFHQYNLLNKKHHILQIIYLNFI